MSYLSKRIYYVVVMIVGQRQNSDFGEKYTLVYEYIEGLLWPFGSGLIQAAKVLLR